MSFFLFNFLYQKYRTPKEYYVYRKLNTQLSYSIINVCDSRKIGLIEIINPYRIRVRRIAP